MAKKKQMKTSRIVLLVILVIIIAVVAYQKYGGKEAAPAGEEERAGEEAQQQTTASESAQRVQTPVEEEKPLYPDLCYAAGGKPVAASKGCAAGEESIGDVQGFKTRYICCVKK